MTTEKRNSERDSAVPWKVSKYQGPRSFAEPIPVEIPAEEIEVFSFFEEAGVHIITDGLDKYVLVPEYAVDLDRQVVKCQLGAESGDGSSILVYFPPTSLGGTIVTISHELALELANSRLERHGAV